jgi:hypothetical protein
MHGACGNKQKRGDNPMKRVLAIALLFSVAKISAVGFQEASSMLSSAQARVADVQKRIEATKASIDQSHSMAKSVEGKHEYGADMKRKTSECRALIERHNKMVEQDLKEAEAALQAALNKIGRHHEVTHDGTRYSIVQRARKKLEPIRSAMPASAAAY